MPAQTGSVLGAMRSKLLFTFALALALLGPAASAAAHGGNPDYRSVIDELRPANDAVELEVIDYDADIKLTAAPGTVVELPGYEGEPYMRILADGTVQVNQRSESAYLNTDRYAAAEVPASATDDPEAKPVWEEVRTDGIFQWHDHRAHWMSPEPPARLDGVTERTKVFDYEIPLTIDGRESAILGTLWWVGPEEGSKLPFVLAGVAILVLGGAGTVLVRRRREDGAGKPPDEAW